MALDEPNKNDYVVTEQDIKFAIDKDLLEKARPIRIDFIDSGGQTGFQITSRLPTGGGCC